MRGTVKWYDASRGFGFIRQDGGGDVFLHVSELRKAGLETVDPDQPIEFTTAPGKNGPKAVDLALVPDDGPFAGLARQLARER